MRNLLFVSLEPSYRDVEGRNLPLAWNCGCATESLLVKWSAFSFVFSFSSIDLDIWVLVIRKQDLCVTSAQVTGVDNKTARKYWPQVAEYNTRWTCSLSSRDVRILNFLTQEPAACPQCESERKLCLRMEGRKQNESAKRSWSVWHFPQFYFFGARISWWDLWMPASHHFQKASFTEQCPQHTVWFVRGPSDPKKWQKFPMFWGEIKGAFKCWHRLCNLSSVFVRPSAIVSWNGLMESQRVVVVENPPLLTDPPLAAGPPYLNPWLADPDPPPADPRTTTTTTTTTPFARDG